MKWATSQVVMQRWRFLAWMLLMLWVGRLVERDIFPAFIRGVGAVRLIFM